MLSLQSVPLRISGTCKMARMDITQLLPIVGLSSCIDNQTVTYKIHSCEKAQETTTKLQKKNCLPTIGVGILVNSSCKYLRKRKESLLGGSRGGVTATRLQGIQGYTFSVT